VIPEKVPEAEDTPEKSEEAIVPEAPVSAIEIETRAESEAEIESKSLSETEGEDSETEQPSEVDRETAEPENEAVEPVKPIWESGTKTVEYAPPKVPIFGDAAYELERYISSLKSVLPVEASETRALEGENSEEERPEEKLDENPENETIEPTDTMDAEPKEGAADEETADPTDDGAEYSSLVSMVRDTPRLPPAVVREAIMELCSEYRNLPELASMLSRSRSALRRHYLTSMLREGLLEMEFPDRVGHPGQRYRTLQSNPEVPED